MDQLGSVGTYFPWGESKGGTNPLDTWSYGTYWRDSADSLDYANNRYYSNAYGRFMTPDPYTASGQPRIPQSWNRYSYVNGDPTNGNDPSGLFCSIDDASCDPEAPDPSGDNPDNPCYGPDGFTPLPGPSCEAQGGPPPTPPAQAPVPQCSIDVFTRGVPFKGSPANHTYIEISDPALGILDILEGGPTNPHNPVRDPKASYGDLKGYIDQVFNGVVTGGLPGTNPAKNRELLSDSGGTGVCDEVLALRIDVQSYNSGNLVNYAPIPNGTTTFNSNSFTFTLLNQVGLTGAASQAIGWSPGWGQLVPGL